MGWDTALAAIGGGLQGGLDMYSWQKDYEQKDRAQDAKTQIETLKLELREMLALAAESGRMTRHETPSGNVQAQQAGATARTEIGQAGQDRRLNVSEQGRNERWFNPSANAELGAETSRRGQDITSTTARRGQDVGATTSRRGQDLTFKSSEMRDATARRGQDVGASTAAAGQANARAIAGMPARTGSGVNFYDRPSGSLPITPVQTAGVGRTLVSPPAAAPGGNDQAEAARLIAAYDAEKDPQKKEEIQKQMQAVLARLKGGGG